LDNHIQVALRTVQCLIGRRAPYSAMPHWTEGTVQCNASLDGGHRTVQCLTGRRAPYRLDAFQLQAVYALYALGMCVLWIYARYVRQ